MDPPHATTPPATTTTTDGGGEKPRIKVQLYKTEPCQNWIIYGTCRYGNLCKFAHGMNEQRSRLRHPKYKTSMCKDFPLGKCNFGNRCNFAHSLDELRAHTAAAAAAAAAAANGQFNNPPISLAPPSPQHVALLQTPVSVLPDGRTVSTFLPVHNKMESPVTRRVAGDLRRNQSTGTLRTPDYNSYQQQQQQQQQQHFMMSNAAGIDNIITPSHMSMYTQPLTATSGGYVVPPNLQHLQQQEQVARRVASLTQLRGLRSSASHASLTNTSSAYVLHSSSSTSLAHPYIGTLNNHSPATAVSYGGGGGGGEFDHMPFMTNTTADPEQHPYISKRTLTSSASMQTLPRFNMQTGWGGANDYSAGNQMLSGGSGSGSSAATLIDSDVWTTTTPPVNGQQHKPPLASSRFFPSSANANTTTSAIDSLGIFYE